MLFNVCKLMELYYIILYVYYCKIGFKMKCFWIMWYIFNGLMYIWEIYKLNGK